MNTSISVDALDAVDALSTAMQAAEKGNEIPSRVAINPLGTTRGVWQPGRPVPGLAHDRAVDEVSVQLGSTRYDSPTATQKLPLRLLPPVQDRRASIR